MQTHMHSSKWAQFLLKYILYIYLCRLLYIILVLSLSLYNYLAIFLSYYLTLLLSLSFIHPRIRPSISIHLSNCLVIYVCICVGFLLAVSRFILEKNNYLHINICMENILHRALVCGVAFIAF